MIGSSITAEVTPIFTADSSSRPVLDSPPCPTGQKIQDLTSKPL